MKRSRTIISGISILAGAILIAALYIFPKLDDTSTLSEELHPGIEAHTSGCISVSAPIQISLSDKARLLAKHSNGDLADGGIFNISPSIKGRAIWLDNYTIEFRPSEPLNFGEKYNIEVNMAKLVDITNAPRKYRFEVYTIRPNYSAAVEDLSMYEEQKNCYRLNGYINTDDSFSADKVEKMLKISDKKLAISWSHENRNMRHKFVIDSIKSDTEAKVLKIEIDGKIMGSNKEENFEVEIPEKDAFRLLNVAVEYDPEFRIVATFSDAIAKGQRIGDYISLTSSPQMRFMSLVNKIYIYPTSRLIGEYELSIHQGIKSRNDKQLEQTYTQTIEFEDLTPSVEFIKSGSILPTTSSMKIPFRSINLSEVEVSVTKIYSNNILQFLQENSLDGDWEIYRVGQTIAKKRIVLGDSLNKEIKNPHIYQLDIGQIIGNDRNAIYRVTIQGVDYDEDGREYIRAWVPDEQRINILLSNLGITAKSSKQNVVSVYVSNLLTTSPESGAEIEIFDFTHQCIGRGKSDTQGMCDIKVSGTPHIVVVTSRGTKGYLRLEGGDNLSVSRFDVQGQNVEGDFKGFIYGERGVWRPGDGMHLTFMLCDKLKSLPESHPLRIKLFDPYGQIVSTQSALLGKDGICSFTLKSDPEAVTGTYTVKVELGNNKFEKSLRIETIKPNRLKINMKFAPVVTANFSGSIHAQWLHGAKASGMKAKIEAELTPSINPFPEYKDYHFQDESMLFDNQTIELVSAQLDSEGNLRFVKTLNDLEEVPGMLAAKVTARVFEPGGNFSTDVFNVKCAPFERFVGIKLPYSKSNFITTEDNHKFDIVMLDYLGNKIDNAEVEIEINKMEWEWWWNTSGHNRAYFMQNSIDRTILTQKVIIKNGKGEFDYKWDNRDWGLYTIRVRDINGEHSTAQVFRVDWADTPHSTRNSDEATLLTISTDKEQYKVGESAKISFPSAKGTKALVTVESSTGVLESRWIDCKDNTTTTEIATNDKMTPNVYVWVSLIQPYDRLKNDAPLRLYGVVPLLVDDITTRLEPQVKAPNEVRPEQPYTIEVSEKSGKPMSYTLAIVDEGLLDLTRFKTPDPWNMFYAREALEVKTWDMYNDVIGAYGGSIEQLFSVGGDSEIISRGDIKAQRFTPVVKFLGPFELKPNQKAQHTVTLPNYVGAVRSMVVAAHQGRAFGSAETRSLVHKPLMTLMTMPRTVATDDIVEVPVTIFAMQDKVGEVSVELTELQGFTIIGESTRKVTFKNEGEQNVIFKVKASSVPAYGAIKVKCTSADDSATDRVELNIQDPTSKSRVRTMTVIAPNSHYEGKFRLAGRKNTNTLTLNLSTLLAVDISGRLSELTEYPHGCLEQIVSGAFPQLYLSKITNLNEDDLKRVQSNVNSTLNKLLKYRCQDGSLSYWPNENRVNRWSSVWAGHFMVEARNMGYSTPSGIYERWLDYEKLEAKTWRWQDGAQETQAYRLWVLSLAGESDRGAMNRLRENPALSPLSKRLLAGAYAADGRKDLCRTLLESAQQMEQKISNDECFGSVERDLAIEAILYKNLGNQTQAFEIAKQLAEKLSSDQWLSTQTTAWSLMAVAQIVEPSKDDSSLDVDYVVANISNKLTSVSPIESININAKQLEGEVNVKINNNNSHSIYLTMESFGVPIRGSEKESMNNLIVKVEFLDQHGNTVNISRLNLGEDFRARITITPNGSTLDYSNLALTQIFPSGWEIRSEGTSQLDDRIEYRDIRDDRIMIYFNLNDRQPLVIETQLAAVYAGEFYLPGVIVESMYNGDISAQTKGVTVSVVR